MICIDDEIGVPIINIMVAYFFYYLPQVTRKCPCSQSWLLLQTRIFCGFGTVSALLVEREAFYIMFKTNRLMSLLAKQF